MGGIWGKGAEERAKMQEKTARLARALAFRVLMDQIEPRPIK